MPDTILNSLASHGVLGLFCAAAVWWAWQKDRELTAERAARIADAKAGTEVALRLQKEVNDAVDKLADILREVRGGR